MYGAAMGIAMTALDEAEEAKRARPPLSEIFEKLTRDHVRIMDALAQAGGPLNQTQLEAHEKVALSRGTIRKKLLDLADLRLVTQPGSRRMGYVITEKGREWLQ